MNDREGGESEKGGARRGRGEREASPRATGLDDTLAQYCKLAIVSAAEELGVDPLVLARRLNQGEIARLAHLLNAALRHVENTGLRHRIEDLLMAITDGAMPGSRPESELDWALRVARRRREQRESSGDEPAADAPDVD